MRVTEVVAGGLNGSAPGAARLHVVDGVPLLRPAEQVFDAMLYGWRNQQLARNLAVGTVEGRRAMSWAGRWPALTGCAPPTPTPTRLSPADVKLTLTLCGAKADALATAPSIHDSQPNPSESVKAMDGAGYSPADPLSAGPQ
jgi:hypothetical protein